MVLSTLALLTAVERRGLRWWAIYVLAAAAAVYTHYIAVLVLIPQAAWALWTHRETTCRQLIANGLVVVAFLPWLPSFIVQLRHSELEAAVLDVVAPLTPSELAEISGRALLGHPFITLRELFGVVPLIAIAAAVVVALAALRVGLGAGRRRLGAPLATHRGLIVLLAIAPLVGVGLYSLQPDTSFLLPRNISVAVPYALLLFGWLLASARPRLALALSFVAVAALAVGAVRMLGPDYQRADGRDAARYIDANAPPDTPVIDIGFASFESPPAAGTRMHLERPHPVVPAADRDAAWAVAARRGSPVFVTFLDPSRLPEVVPGAPQDPDLFAPPPRFAPRYELVAEHVSRGLVPIPVREYAPR